MKVLYVYPRTRKKLYEDYMKGYGPNDSLFGLTYMKKYSISAEFKCDGYHGILKKGLSPIEKITLLNLGQSLKLMPYINKNDIMFSTSDAAGLGLSLINRYARMKKPHVYQTVGLRYTRFSTRPKWVILRGLSVYRRILSCVDKIVYVTPCEKEFFIKSLKLPEDKLRLVPFGIDVNFFKPSTEPSDDFILSAGKDPNRDYKTLIEAVKNENLKLKIVCNKNNMRGLSIPNNVEVHFDLDFKSLRSFYAKSKLFIISTNNVEYAAGQTVMLQCMAMGKAIIASKSKGLSNSIDLEDYKHCIFVEPNNAKDLREKIYYLLNNPKEITRMGRNARKLVKRKYHSENYARELSKIFWEVYNEGG